MKKTIVRKIISLTLAIGILGSMSMIFASAQKLVRIPSVQTTCGTMDGSTEVCNPGGTPIHKDVVVRVWTSAPAYSYTVSGEVQDYKTGNTLRNINGKTSFSFTNISNFDTRNGAEVFSSYPTTKLITAYGAHEVHGTGNNVWTRYSTCAGA